MKCARPQLSLSLLLLFFSLCVSYSDVAQNTTTDPSRVQSRYVVIPPRAGAQSLPTPSGTLREWNGSFTYNGVNYPYVMVGADPATNQRAVITTLFR
jgi:hypothetical protein